MWLLQPSQASSLRGSSLSTTLLTSSMRCLPSCLASVRLANTNLRPCSAPPLLIHAACLAAGFPECKIMRSAQNTLYPCGHPGNALPLLLQFSTNLAPARLPVQSHETTHLKTQSALFSSPRLANYRVACTGPSRLLPWVLCP